MLFWKNLLQSHPQNILESIKDARDDYKAGRTQTHEEIFGR